MKIIVSIDGIVVGKIDQYFVRVKVTEPDIKSEMFIDYPIALFKDKNNIRYGQPVSYEIRECSDGTHIQTVVSRIDTQKNPHLDEVTKLLDNIKLR